MREIGAFEAKTRLGQLLDRVEAGEEIVITKNGVPQAKIVPLPTLGGERMPAGALGVSYISEDFDAPDPTIEALFNGA